MGQTATLTLWQRVIRAGTWTLGGHVASQVLRLASNLIMTRLLVPEMFGVMALVNVVMTGLALFSDIGLNQGIIQSRRGHDPAYLNTAWTVQILRGVLIWLVALGIGGALYLLGTLHWLPKDSVYVEPVLPYVFAVISFTALINGFMSTRLAIANRSLLLGRVTMIELNSQFATISFMVVWALVDRTIWALVAGALFGSLFRVAMSYVSLPGEHNRLHWDKEAFSEIYRFGKWIFLNSILGFLAANGDRLLLGGMIDSATLGLYSIAFIMADAVRGVFVKLSSRVALPALSEVARESLPNLKRTYYRLRIPIDVVTLLAVGLLFSSGDLVIRLLYDERYHAAGHMLEILSLTLLATRYQLTGQCFMAIGKPRLMVPINVVRLVALFGVTPLAFRWYGLDGALWAIVGSALVTLPMTYFLKVKHNLFDFWREVSPLPLFVVGYGLGYLIAPFITHCR
jgi:O-antigen/teichoic acid export membrane protein